MAVNIINGSLVADHVRSEVMDDVQHLLSKGQRPPKLMVVIVGSDPASQIYVRAKTSACTKVGIESETMRLPDTISEKELREIIRRLNDDPSIDGILVQLPLPAHIHPLTVIETIDPRKDVDGFHPMNVGRLTIGQPTFKSCTPAGVLELLRFYSIPTKGKHAVVVGASNIVGSPMAIMLSRENETGKATTTICHKYTKDLTKHTIDADILVVAVGLPRLITGHMVKEGAVVIDVGMNRIPDPSSEKGYRLVGDCEYESVATKASWITPVPGGVGPMTVAMLMKNTLLAAKNSIYPD
jgi:methylenetetrahydrofolate dehydrogenase (NADP+) / methenyltetrahydrofolate cyclohydrolase